MIASGDGVSVVAFDPRIPLLARGRSLYHGWLPLLLLFLLQRLGHLMARNLGS
jgi:hypothetical protein